MTNRADLDLHRLPRHTVPARYDLELAPDLADASFAGTVTIAVTTSESVDELVLNAIELDIRSCQIDGRDATFELDIESERLFIVPTGGVTAGDHTVTIAFTGILNDKLRGWYRSTYRDADGNEQVIATTQMQSTDCRRAFPCWDEPDFKAVFSVTLIVEEDLLAVSNGEEIGRDDIGAGQVRVTFADTMVMSTYLVAFVVGPLEATEWVDVDGVPMRIVHVPGKSHLTDFGLEIGAFALRWFQQYYRIPYPSDKVDLLALPDFAAGAMENLGCITFRESLLLVDPETSTQSERQLVTDVVAHELAHMWFGDLVTMRWWNGIWLNEAFATFMELAAADAFRPEWERWISFGLERSVAFETDSLSSTRSVEFEVNSPADAEGMFDVLTYQKGGALLRMLEQHLGEQAFQAGVSQYLKQHAYGNTDTSDLWDAIEQTTGEPVRRIMDSWIWQPGYPLVRANVEAGQLILTQQRFTFNQGGHQAANETEPGAELETDSVWAIPVAVRHGDDVTNILLDQPEARIDLDSNALNGGAAIVVNAGGHGFFRVAYHPDLLARFTPEVLATLNTLERYNIVDDAWNAVVAGELAATDYLELVERFAAEDALGVWQRIGAGLRAVRRLLDPPATSDSTSESTPGSTGESMSISNFEARVVALAQPALQRLGEPAAGEADLVASLRGELLSLVAITGADTATVDRAVAYYQQWEHDPGSVDAELAAKATSIVAATGDESVYERFVEQMHNATNPQVQLRHMYALTEFDQAELIARTCELAMSGTIKTQNAPFVLNLCIANRRFGNQAFEFVRDNWATANAKFPRNTIVRMVASVRTLDTPDAVATADRFFQNHPIEQAAQTLAQILERQQVNAALRQREQPRLIAALADHS